MLRGVRGLLVGATIVGFGLGGFFDGIMLHQVLQWHHLLSLVPGETFRSLGTQILADGLFHVLMYVVTVIGLWFLWRHRREAGHPGMNWRKILGGGLLGFAIWNVVDVAFFHWILGIHRIRVGVPNPMLYDLGWLAVFGFAPLGLASLLLKRSGRDGSGGGGATVALSMVVLLAAPLAARPQPNSDAALVIFPPGASAATAMNAAVRADVGLLWIDPGGRMMAVALQRPGAAGRLYRAGAIFVTRSPTLAGCAVALRA